MAIERSRSRMMFKQDEVVELRQQCFTLGRLFEPGKYLAGELPDEAFSMGLVEALPPVKGKTEQRPPQDPAEDA
jgi:hypothetical protein